MNAVDKQIRNARPSLYAVAPLTATIAWIFVLINIIIALAFWFIYAPSVPILIVGHVINLRVWGIIFALLAGLHMHALLTNRWEELRRALVVGLVIKATWMVALIIRCFQSPQSTILFTAIWLMFAMVQAATYVHFLPVSERRQND